MVFMRSIHLHANFKMSLFFLLLSSTPLNKCIMFFFLYFLVEGHLSCFQVLAITNHAAMNIAEEISLSYECASFGYMPSSGIDGS